VDWTNRDGVQEKWAKVKLPVSKFVEPLEPTDATELTGWVRYELLTGAELIFDQPKRNTPRRAHPDKQEEFHLIPGPLGELKRAIDNALFGPL